MHRLAEQIRNYVPYNEQELRDQNVILNFLKNGATPFERTNEICHMTASSWIVNQDRTKALMVYHNIYKSWSWTGGHADGDTDLLGVAMREAREETGIATIHPVSEDIFSLETIVVEGHEKRGKYVASHLHMNITYLLEADENEALQIKPDENSGVMWIAMDELADKVSEPWMLDRVYRKLNEKMKIGD